MSELPGSPEHQRPPLTEPQEATLRTLCERYEVEYDAGHYHPQFDLPEGWVAGWLGGPRYGHPAAERTTLFVGVSPEGEASS